jgi:guanidinopropionase
MPEPPNPDDFVLLEALYWWGIPTLFRCHADPDPAACDIALVGVPHSSGNGSTERDQHLGPRAVRHVSAHYRRAHRHYGIVPWDHARIHDLGDVPLPEAMDNEACVARISDYFRRIADADTRTVSVGGDHAVTGAILRGLAHNSSPLTSGSKVALVHLDAHTDTYEHIPHWMGAKHSAAHWAAYLVREGRVDPHHSIQIGMRGNPRTLAWHDKDDDLGYQVIDIDTFRELDLDEVAATIRERVGGLPVYITFDLDCLDPSIAPAVSNLEVGDQGFTLNEATQLVRSVRGLNVIGGDVVCLMPTKDTPNNMTAMVAAHVAFELVSLLADKRRQEAEGRLEQRDTATEQAR